MDIRYLGSKFKSFEMNLRAQSDTVNGNFNYLYSSLGCSPFLLFALTSNGGKPVSI